MKHDSLFIKYLDKNGNEHLQSISDLLEVGRLIEGDGPKEGEEMEVADDNIYNFLGFPIAKITFED